MILFPVRSGPAYLTDCLCSFYILYCHSITRSVNMELRYGKNIMNFSKNAEFSGNGNSTVYVDGQGKCPTPSSTLDTAAAIYRNPI